MGYFKELDEFEELELNTELNRRRVLREQGLCDYCKRPNHTKPCKFPFRHLDSRINAKPSVQMKYCSICGRELQDGTCPGLTKS